MKKLTKSLLALSALFFSYRSANALDVIAAHPTKNEIAVIGANQVLYILNSEDFSVIKRISLDYASDGFDKFFHYSADGKYLLFNSFMKDFKYFNTESYTVSRTIEVSDDTYPDPTKSKILTMDAGDGVLKIIDFNSGVQKMQANFEKIEGYGRFIGASLNVETNKVFLFTKKKDSKEKKESYSYSDFKEKTKTEEITTRAKNDGETSEIYIFDLTTKTLSAPTETWMSGSSELEIYPYKEKYYCVGSSKVFSIDETANVEVLEFEGSSVSESLFIAEKNLLVLISSRDVENGEKQKFSHGVSMDFIRGATYANGWIYFCTGNYRVSAISTDGGMKEVKHVF